jgi:tetratricopeptide (TPR) repeat protein
MPHMLRPLLLILIITFVVYSLSLCNGFVWDDELLIVHNPDIKRPDALRSAFSAELFHKKGEFASLTYYRPLITVTNAISYALFGLKPLFYHLTNVLIHLLNCALVYLLLARYFAMPHLALLLATLVFALHPIHTESVCFISGKTDLLATTFFLLATLCYIAPLRPAHPKNAPLPHAPRLSLLLLTPLFYALGLLAKEMVIVLPVLLLALDYFAMSQPLRTYLARNTLRLLLSLFPLLLIAVAYLAVRFTLIKGITMPPYPTRHFTTTLFTMLPVLLYYIKLTLLPTSMLCDYTNFFPIVTSIHNPLFVLSSAATVALLTITLILLLRKSPYFLALFWFELTLLPVLNIFPLGIWLAERFLYLPSIGFALLIGLIVQSLFREGRKANLLLEFTALGLIVLLLLGYALKTAERSLVWKDDYTLWNDAVKKNPNNPQALTLFAEVLVSQKHYAEARDVLQRVMTSRYTTLYPTQLKTLARTFIGEARYDEALEVIEKFHAAAPDSADAYVLEGDIYTARDELPLAEEAYARAIQLRPEIISARVGLMRLYANNNEHFDRVLTLSSQIIAINPDYAEALLFQGIALLHLNHTDYAIQAFREAIRRDPTFKEAYLFLASLYDDLGETDPSYYQAALDTYGQLLLRNETNVDALFNMGLVYAKLKKYAEARELWTRLLRLDPNNQDALHNLRILESAAVDSSPSSQE